MNIAEASIRFRTFTTIATIALALAGLVAYFEMGRLEDPEFTIKEARIVTAYPGASAAEVADEVTEQIESAVQRLGQLDRVESISQPGLSIVTVVIRDQYDSADLPQVWDELRRRVGDAARTLPPGAMAPVVHDDFGDVYGVFYAISGDGFTNAELEDYATTLRRELMLVDGVGSIRLFGVQPEVVYVEFSRERLAKFGLAPEVLASTLAGQNLAAPAGFTVVGPTRIRVEPTGQLESVEAIGDLLLMVNPEQGTKLYLRDVAEIKRGYAEPASVRMWFDGRPAVGLAISTVAGGNVVRMGDAVTKRIEELKTQIPIGIEIGLVAHQANTVTEAIRLFISSLIEAFAIVIGVLMIFMGLRAGLIIGLVLTLTVLGTFAIMHATGVMLERVSLGALVIALALMVDNAIVVVDGMRVMIQKGVDRIESAAHVVRQTAMPLFGATLVAVFAFAAIGLSQDRTGEYTRSLFLVMLYALVLSWILAITVTPLLGFWLLRPSSKGSDDPYSGFIYRAYGRLLDLLLRYRWATLAVTILLLVLSIGAFQSVTRNFFPPSTRPQFMVHTWHRQGTAIEETERHALDLDRRIREMEGVTNVATIVGSGSPRFLLTYTPEINNPAYSLLLVEVDDHRKVNDLMARVEGELRDQAPDAIMLARPFSLGPGDLQKMEVRIRGPEADTVQRLAGEVRRIFDSDPDIIDVQDDWRERTPIVRPVISEMQARDLGLTRRDIAQAMLYATQGVRMGVYREGDKLLPIVMRPPAEERERVHDLRDAQVWSAMAGARVPMAQVVSGFETGSEHTFLCRRDRLPTVTLQADAASGDANGAVERLTPAIESVPLPPGYSIEWGGEWENSRQAQAALAGNMPLVGLLMVLTVVSLFNAVRPPLIIFSVVPLALIGVSFGLLFTGQPLGFMAILGFMSLAGMLVKNAIVLLDEIGVRLQGADDPMRAIREAGISRLSPVVLAALTTVLGMIPLLADAFFVAMSVTIMAGLAFATLLTLVVVPVLYAILFRFTFKDTPAATAAKPGEPTA
ncbi:MAG: efflux RND transporter permease subunit [Phycisphaerales bacterium]|nr:efflux RND transporter permease subunit [Phycisphaerales bacterium]